MGMPVLNNAVYCVSLKYVLLGNKDNNETVTQMSLNKLQLMKEDETLI